MNIAGMDYKLDRKCLEIYFRGCLPPHCEGCHNAGLQEFSVFDNIEDYKKIIEMKIATGMIKEIWLLGGEPLDQNRDQFYNFIKFLKTFDIKLWLWTKYDNINKIPFLEMFDYVKMGRYNKNLESYIDERFDIELASSNQKIIEIDKNRRK